MTSPATEPSDDTAALTRTARRLAYVTIAWNVIEAAVAVTAGVAASSIALIGFGIDSTIETLSAVVVVWHLDERSTRDEAPALRLIGVSFFLLAAYVVVESVRDLATTSEAAVSVPGLVITGLSVVVMPLLALAKQRTGRRLDSKVVLADAVETWLCTYLSALVLIGLLANAALGWWWADPVAALGVAYLAVREGLEAWEDATDG